MSLCDCIRCWSARCQCGYEWRKDSIASLDDMIALLQWIVIWKKAHPDAFPSLPYPLSLEEHETNQNRDREYDIMFRNDLCQYEEEHEKISHE